MKIRAFFSMLLIAAAFSRAAQEPMLVASYGSENSSAYLEPAQMQGQPGVAVVFEGTKDIHYYASQKSAPTPGTELKVEIQAQNKELLFGDAVYPKYSHFDDPMQGKIEVWAGNFIIFVPFKSTQEFAGTTMITAKITGMACTNKICLAPFEKTITQQIDLSQAAQWKEISFEPGPRTDTAAASDKQVSGELIQNDKPENQDAKSLADVLSGWNETVAGTALQATGTGWYLGLSILAGLSINIMPCVLPVLPLIILRLVGQSKESTPRRVGLGLSFCGGIVLFFAVFAIISISVKIATGSSLDLNSLYRSPAAVTTMFLLIVLFALALLDVITITLPGFAAGQSGRSGFISSVGTGFLAGVLSTPCSGAVIGAVLVWAQTQALWISALSLILMGVGMALPYAILISIPKLLALVPKPGTWMEIFKKTGGFLLLAIAVKFMLAGLAKEHLLNVLLYGVVFAFCVWMWGTWVNFNTPAARRWTVRGMAAIIAIAGGLWLLPRPQEAKIDWQAYDAAVVEQAVADGRPVLLKFTADWCTNCKVVNKRVYQDTAIAKLIGDKGLVAVIADTTQADFPAAVDMKTVFSEPGNVPLTVILDPKEKTITKLRGIFAKEELTKTLAGLVE